MGRLRYVPLLVFEFILMGLYLNFTTYAGMEEVKKKVEGFQDTHVMIFIGFAYLMTFLKKYCYSATGYNLLLAAIVIQWSLLCQGFFHMKNDIIIITPKLLLEADIMSATVLITFGALLGLASGSQLLFIAIVESAVGSINMYVNEKIYEISDIGGSIGIHAYGAYFGLGVSLALRIKKPPAEHAPVSEPTPSGGISPGSLIPQVFRGRASEVVRLDGPSYTSDVTAMLGAIFLWIYWPSFNSALASTEVERQRAIVNTYLSLASCTVVTFVLSAAVSHKPGKLDMVHIQNSTLAGGVAVGAVANMFIGPGVAIAIGIGAAFISVLGYRYLSPKLEKLRIQDTCGVNNLHGMPGIYSGLLSVLMSSLATSEVYTWEMANIFPAAAIVITHKEIARADEVIEGAGAGTGAGPGNVVVPGIDAIIPRTMDVQAGYQAIALASTLGVALFTGVVCGLIVRLRIFSPLNEKQRYDDDVNWELP